MGEGGKGRCQGGDPGAKGGGETVKEEGLASFTGRGKFVGEKGELLL